MILDFFNAASDLTPGQYNYIRRIETMLHAEDDLDEIDEEEEECQVRIPATGEFNVHTSAILSMDVNRKNSLVVTADADSYVYIWDAPTMSLKWHLADHVTYIVAACFSYDGEFLATGDATGMINVYQIDAETVPPINSHIYTRQLNDLCLMQWHKYELTLLIGSENNLYKIEMPSGAYSVMQGDATKIKFGQLTWNSSKFFAVYTDSKLILWDVEVCARLCTFFAFDDVAVLACSTLSATYVVADAHSHLMFFSNNGIEHAAYTWAPVNCIDFSVGICEQELFACGTMLNEVTVWNLEAYTISSITSYNAGITTINFITPTICLVATTDGSINAQDALEGVIYYKLVSDTNFIYEIKYHPTEHFVVTISQDSVARVFMLPPNESIEIELEVEVEQEEVEQEEVEQEVVEED